jgi:hypothetical protein
MSCGYSLASIVKDHFIRIGYFIFPASSTVLMEGVQSDLAAKHGVTPKFFAGKTEQLAWWRPGHNSPGACDGSIL